MFYFSCSKGLLSQPQEGVDRQEAKDRTIGTYRERWVPCKYQGQQQGQHYQEGLNGDRKEQGIAVRSQRSPISSVFPYARRHVFKRRFLSPPVCALLGKPPYNTTFLRASVVCGHIVSCPRSASVRRSACVSVELSEVARTVRRELGAEISELFREFDEKAIAAASLAQVHMHTAVHNLKVVLICGQ